MRTKINFDNDWRFCLGDLPPHKPTDGWGGAKARAYSKSAAAVDFDDSDWRIIDLPHDFVSEGSYCFESGNNSDMGDIPEMESIDSRLFAGGCLAGGVGWYRKKFMIEDKNKRVYIHFDGVYRSSTVYVNQYFIGTHASGYTGFYYDITDFINPDGENVIAVRVDASDREGWWYEGGGIYHHTWLEVTDEIHIEPYGLFAAAENIDLQKNISDVNIRCTVLNRSFDNKDVDVKFRIRDDEDMTAAESECSFTVKEWDETECCEKLFIENIRTWSLNDPYLYTAVVSVYEKGVLCDEYSVKFGIRDIRFDADKGFFLNGEHIKIKGVCCHHDHAGVGIAVPDSVNEYRIRRIKEMGANAFRSSHYPASPALLDICDRLGMLVFSETRRMSSAPEDLECLHSMVKRGRNHPSIFLWGIGNEEIFSQHRPETAGTTRTMTAEIKKLDNTRPVTSAVVCWDGEQRYDNAEKYVDVTKNLDIMGFNYCQTAWDDYHRRMPAQPVIITEESSNSWTRGCRCTDESRGHYYAFDSDNFNKCQAGAKAVRKEMGEKAWRAAAERDYLAGMFVWTGFDYRGEPTPLKYPAVYTQFGIFDYCGFPKDNYYYYKSWWGSEDVLHIFYDRNKIYCYSNFDEVEIFAGDKSYGRKTMDRNWYLEWENVVYEKGDLTAKGFRNGEIIMEKIIQTAGDPYKIDVRAYNEAAGDTMIFNISILDKNGRLVPDADNKLSFEITGGILLGTGNGNPGDHDSEKTNERRAFNGLCQVLARADRESGAVRITVKSDGLNNAECLVKLN